MGDVMTDKAKEKKERVMKAWFSGDISPDITYTCILLEDSAS